MADNHITVSGNMTRDPELRFTTGGRAIANFGLAVSRRYQANGEWQEQTSFLNVVAWAALAENVCASLAKGNRVTVNGRMESRQYETNEGEKRTVFEIVADDVAASLKWATVTIERTERTDASSSSTAAAPHMGDEEPF